MSSEIWYRFASTLMRRYKNDISSYLVQYGGAYTFSLSLWIKTIVLHYLISQPAVSRCFIMNESGGKQGEKVWIKKNWHILIYCSTSVFDMACRRFNSAYIEKCWGYSKSPVNRTTGRILPVSGHMKGVFGAYANSEGPSHIIKLAIT